MPDPDQSPLRGTGGKRADLRHVMRRRRRALDAREQARAADALLRQATDLEAFDAGNTLAFYIANDGEIDPALLLELAHSRGKACCLPVLSRDGTNKLLFAGYKPGDTLVPNQFGIPEPDTDSVPMIDAAALDLVFLPLVAFDAHGTRLGMGGGYYDRTFGFLKDNPGSGPRLVGLAHDFQRVEKLEAAGWDIPLDEIMTDRKRYPVP